MKIPNGLWPVLKKCAWTMILLLPSIGTAETRTEELKRCLRDFHGIEWQLPYQPPLRIRSCASETVTYDTSEKTTGGHRSLELIGELTLGSDASNLSSDETYAALQDATFTHFDALFRRHGYRRTNLEHGDARTRVDPNTLRMLAGLSPLPEESAESKAKRAAAEPPIPYVNLVRYVRSAPDHDVTLTYKTEAKNTWRITIDGPSAVSATPGTIR